LGNDRLGSNAARRAASFDFPLPFLGAGRGDGNSSCDSSATSSSSGGAEGGSAGGGLMQMWDLLVASEIESSNVSLESLGSWSAELDVVPD